MFNFDKIFKLLIFAALGVGLIGNSSLKTETVSLSSYTQTESKSYLAQERLNLTDRVPNEYGSKVFADNILLALHYLKGDVGDLVIGGKLVNSGSINWEKVNEPFEVDFTLNPGEVFAFHSVLLPDFQKETVKTMNSRFYMEDGYKAIGGLGGNGVCHLASLINWVAVEAGLEVISRVNHNFAPVTGVPRENGTSIRYSPDNSNSPNQNLYIKNNFNYPVTFEFQADKNDVALRIVKQTNTGTF